VWKVSPFCQGVVKMKLPLYCALTRALKWQSQVNENFRDEADFRVKNLVDRLPHGSGIDGVTTVEMKNGVLFIHISFHHMNENGMYDGWTNHTIRVKSSLERNFELTISGRDRNDVKEYLGEMFDEVLRREVE